VRIKERSPCAIEFKQLHIEGGMKCTKGLAGPFVLSLAFILQPVAQTALANSISDTAPTGALELPNARSIDPVVDEMFPRWRSVRTYLDNERAGGGSSMSELVAWARSLRGEEPLQRLQDINHKVNELLAYESDNRLWRQADYWETPAEALDRGAADCEGFAIFKMYLAKEAGIPLDQTAILVGTLGSNREPHAVLGARVGPLIFALDNKVGSVMTLSGRGDFTPIYSVGVRGAYTYPMNWGSGSTLASRTLDDTKYVRVAAASRQAAEDGITTSVAAPAEDATGSMQAEPPTPATDPVAAAIDPPPPPLKPAAPAKPDDAAVETTIVFRSEPAGDDARRKPTFGGGSLTQLVSFVFR
jgi:predicted transglutaminase-like cysteine proteinase